MKDLEKASYDLGLKEVETVGCDLLSRNHKPKTSKKLQEKITTTKD